MLIHRFHTTTLSINTYLIGDDTIKRAAIIDPTRDVEPYIKYAHQMGLEITDIIETHIHADFISGSKELKYRLNEQPTIHCSIMGGPEWTPSYLDKKVRHGDEIVIGSIRLKAFHTPGHTPEHLIWLCYDGARSLHTPCLAFTGDLLFVGSVGRPDLLGKQITEYLANQLYQSLFVALSQLPDFLEILPGHGAGSLCGKGLSNRPTTTLGYERLFNPFLVRLPFEDWIKNLQKDAPAIPINFQRIKKINVMGPQLLSKTTPSEKEKPLIIDVRGPEAYAEQHIKESINIPFSQSFCNWVSSLLDEDIPLGIVASSPIQLHETIKNLHLIGFDTIAMQMTWEDQKAKHLYPTDTLAVLDVEGLAEKINHPEEALYIIDVRTPSEWQAGHIKEAHHIELARVIEQMDQIPKEAFIPVICGSGYRASVIASLLKNHGFNAANVKGGMVAWKKAMLPLEKNHFAT